MPCTLPCSRRSSKLWKSHAAYLSRQLPRQQPSRFAMSMPVFAHGGQNVDVGNQRRGLFYLPCVSMTEPQEKIIVFQAYDTVMEANLAKTKLDAYGIPCFLTNENFVNLYPIRNTVFPGVQLHIFEIDSEQVRETLTPTTDQVLVCPHCGSQNIRQEVVNKHWVVQLITILLASLAMFFFTVPKPLEYRCTDCKREFESPDYL